MLAIATKYDGTEFRSRTEAEWAEALDRHRLAYSYEPIKFGFHAVMPDHWSFASVYIPDFWVPEIKAWLEVKPRQPNLIEYRKAALLAECTGCSVLVTHGRPLDSETMTIVRGVNKISQFRFMEEPTKFLDLERLSWASCVGTQQGLRTLDYALVDAIETCCKAYEAEGNDTTDERPHRRRVMFIRPDQDHQAACYCRTWWYEQDWCRACWGTMRSYITSEAVEAIGKADAESENQPGR